MASELTIGLIIGASLRGFGSAFGQATKAVNQLGMRIAIAERQQQRLGNAMRRGIAEPGRNLGQLHQKYIRLGDAIRRAEKSQNALNQALAKQKQHTEHRRQLQGKALETYAHAHIASTPLISSVKTFMEQEEAETNLKITMMKADGTFGKFSEIGKLAAQLGTDLPGTKKDFYLLAQSLKKQGISDDVLLGGALKTSAELNVLLDMDQAQGGEFLAKFMESHGLKEADLAKSADYLQRAMFAGGLSRDQMYESMKYYAPKLNSLGLAGAENTEKILAIEAIAGQQGLEGSTFGTGLNMMLTRMNKGPEMLRMATKGMKAEARDMLNDVGVEFEFWDKKGKFKGIEGMISEMAKFEKIRAKYGDKGVDLVANELFGIEGGRLADILAQKGAAGLEQMLAKMREQASLQDRITLKTATLSSAFEALGGVWETAVGEFGSIFADDLKGIAKQLQGLVEWATPFIKENKELIKTGVAIVAGFVGVKVALLGASYAANLLLSPFNAITTFGYKIKSVFHLLNLARFGGAARSVSLLGKAFQSLKSIFGTVLSGIRGAFSVIATGAIHLGSMLGGVLVRGAMLAGNAIVWLGRAMLTNPIGIAVSLIAAGAYYIWSNWEKLQPFFANLWNGITTKFSAAWEWIKSVWLGAGNWVASIWGNVSQYFSDLWTSIAGFFSNGISNIGQLISNFSPLSLFQTVFSTVLNWFGIDLPNTFSGFGKNIIDGLVNGVSNAWNLAKEKVNELGSGIKNWFAEKLGIHSPSRVFKGYGVNIVEGLVLGMNAKADTAQERTKTLGQSMQDVFTLPSLASPAFLPPANTGFGDVLGGLWQGAKQLFGLSAAELTPHSSDNLFAHYQPLPRDTAVSSQSNGQIVINFNPTINLSNTSGSVSDQIQQGLQMSLHELEKLMNRVYDERQRRAY